MSYEDELEQLQNEALAEIEGDDDANTDDNQQEESTSDTDDFREDEEDRGDIEADEEEDDSESDDEYLDDDEEEEEEDEEDTSDTTTDNSQNNDDFEKVTVEINGQTITLDSDEELRAFVKNNRGNTVTSTPKKSQNDRTIEQGNLSEADLGLLIDAKNGDPAAIAKLAKMAKVDIYDMDEDLADSYKPNFATQKVSAVDEVAENIMADKQHYENFSTVLKSVPQDFVNSISTNAEALGHFSDQIKSGMAQKVIPIAIKRQLLQGGSFLESYATVGREMTQEQSGKPEDSKTKRKTNPRAEKLKKKASNSRGSNKGTKTTQNGEDIWAMSTEEFNKKYM